MSGGRVECSLVSADEASVKYDVELQSESTWRGAATISLADGAVDLSVEGAPPWLVELARTFLRGEWRARQKAPSPWPRRINRWREGS
jgi:hypothetical protein